jgi:hypothetical protein
MLLQLRHELLFGSIEVDLRLALDLLAVQPETPLASSHRGRELLSCGYVGRHGQ